METITIIGDTARLAVVSDSHGLASRLRDAVEAAGDIDAAIFLGDGAGDTALVRRQFPNLMLLQVRGNNDYSSQLPDELCVKAGGALIYCTHGHRYRVYYDLQPLYYRAMELHADIALYGHTHVKAFDVVNGVKLLNPGSCAAPRTGRPSYAVLEIEHGCVTANIKTL